MTPEQIAALPTREVPPEGLRYFTIIPGHPNTCPSCQSRTDLVETVRIEEDVVYVEKCLNQKCAREVLFVDDPELHKETV